MSKTIGDKEAQRRALRERSLRPVSVPKASSKPAAQKISTIAHTSRITAVKITTPIGAVEVETKTPFDRTSYQREYMRTYRKTVKARKATLRGEK